MLDRQAGRPDGEQTCLTSAGFVSFQSKFQTRFATVMVASTDFQAASTISGQEQELVSFWAKPHRQKLQALPVPSKFGTVWSAFQTPQGNLDNELEFERHGPLLNIYRPQGAKVQNNRKWLRNGSFHADLPDAVFHIAIKTISLG